MNRLSILREQLNRWFVREVDVRVCAGLQDVRSTTDSVEVQNKGDANVNVVNCTFHGVGSCRSELSAEERSVWLEVAQFETILDAMQGDMNVGVTVDDGNTSDIETIAPSLKKREMSGTFFVPAALLGQPGHLTKGELRELVRMGFGIGSHGLKHCDWRKLSDDDLVDEIHGSRRFLEELVGCPVNTASCPLGSYDRRVLRFLREAGYERVYTSDRGIASEHAWLQARNTICAWDDGESVQRVLSKGQFSPDFLMCKIKRAIKRLR